MRNLFRRSGSGRKVSGGHKTHLQLERLDDRTVLSTFAVTNLLDGVGVVGSLRQAITAANTTPGDDTITFGVTGTINLASALPDLSTNIDIQGPGANLLTVPAGEVDRPQLLPHLHGGQRRDRHPLRPDDQSRLEGPGRRHCQQRHAHGEQRHHQRQLER